MPVQEQGTDLRLKLSLSSEIVIAVVVLVASAVFLMGGLMIGQVKRMMALRMEKESDTLVHCVIGALERGPGPEASRQLGRLAVSAGLASLKVSDAAGTVLGEIPGQTAFVRDMLVPAPGGSGQWTVSIGYDKDELAAVTNVLIVRITLLLALMIILISSALILISRKLLLDPLAALVGASRKVAAGDFSCRVEEGAEGELGTLAVSSTGWPGS